jgi:hypothetical protein
MYYFKEACQKRKIQFEGQQKRFSNSSELKDLIDCLYKKEWVVYCKEPLSNPMHVMQYLGRYTHKVAISNDRIVKIKNGNVSFKWKDYADQNKSKVMTIDGEEFIRRFLLHVLPLNFVKIRHYGILSNRSRKTKLKQCQDIFGLNRDNIETTQPSWKNELLGVNSIDVRICPICCEGKMIRKELLTPRVYSPPNDFFAA